MDLPAQASKRARQFDTARYRRQSLFMKGASSVPPGNRCAHVPVLCWR